MIAIEWGECFVSPTLEAVMMDGGKKQRTSAAALHRIHAMALFSAQKGLRSIQGPFLKLQPGTIKSGRPVHLYFVQFVDAMVMPVRVIENGLRKANTTDFKI